MFGNHLFVVNKGCHCLTWHRESLRKAILLLDLGKDFTVVSFQRKMCATLAKNSNGLCTLCQ